MLDNQRKKPKENETIRLIRLCMKSEFTLKFIAERVFVKKIFMKRPVISISKIATFFIFPYFMSV